MDSFRREIARLVQQQNAVERLSDERMQTLEDNVYAYIDRLFPQELTETHKVEQAGSRFKEWLVFKPRALTAAALLVLVVIATQIIKPNHSEFLLDLPASVAHHHYDAYIDTQAQVSQSLIATDPTPRRQAFITGVIRADLDLSKDFTGIQLERVNSRITDIANDDSTRHWVARGYAVEVLHLAARRSMQDLDVGLLGDALDFYREQTALDDADDANSRFTENHQWLIQTDRMDLQTPADVQQIIELTHQMKVLVQ